MQISQDHNKHMPVCNYNQLVLETKSKPSANKIMPKDDPFLLLIEVVACAAQRMHTSIEEKLMAPLTSPPTVSGHTGLSGKTIHEV